ncbi:MAG: Rieske (2Fe-2S) protein [Pirellulaceae bacterium]|nr:Rieske (2Fe-2S) protein [Pirellulaceae bacterium]
MSDFVVVADKSEIHPGTGKMINLGGRSIAVFNDGGKFFAIDDFCPHQGASLAMGPVEGGCVSCPLHGWRFKLDDGTWTDNPRLSVDSFEVRLRDDGKIELCATPRAKE